MDLINACDFFYFYEPIGAEDLQLAFVSADSNLVFRLSPGIGGIIIKHEALFVAAIIFFYPDADIG